MFTPAFLFYAPSGYYSTMWMLLPAIILSFYAQSKVKSAFSKYSKVQSKSGLTGMAVAKSLLEANGIYDVKVEPIRGDLNNYYDPTNKVIKLSDAVYGKSTITAISVAAHETGHAIQHDKGYLPLSIRSTLVPVANLGSKMAMPLIFMGLMMSANSVLVDVGILLFSAAVLFQFVTLPVEFNASNRALEILYDNGLMEKEEIKPCKKVLSAAALTYVAAALTALANLIRLIVMSNRD